MLRGAKAEAAIFESEEHLLPLVAAEGSLGVGSLSEGFDPPDKRIIKQASPTPSFVVGSQ